MRTSTQRPSVLWKRGQSGPRILVSVGVLFALLGTGWLVGRKFNAPLNTPIPRGLVQIHCEQFDLDNETGLMRAKGVSAQCDDIRIALPPPSEDGAGSVGRLRSIRDHFNSR